MDIDLRKNTCQWDWMYFNPTIFDHFGDFNLQFAFSTRNDKIHTNWSS
jgi:hypothetical protein